MLFLAVPSPYILTKPGYEKKIEKLELKILAQFADFECLECLLMHENTNTL